MISVKKIFLENSVSVSVQICFHAVMVVSVCISNLFHTFFALIPLVPVSHVLSAVVWYSKCH